MGYSVSFPKSDKMPDLWFLGVHEFFLTFSSFLKGSYPEVKCSKKRFICGAKRLKCQAKAKMGTERIFLVV